MKQRLAKKMKRKIDNRVSRLFYKPLYKAALMNKRDQLPSSEQARELIESLRPHEKNSSMFAENTIHNDRLYDLTIIIPAYNVQDYIEECLESILSQQTKYSYTIKVINDDSTDDTLKKLKCYEDNKSVTVISKTKGGVSSARNTGLKDICSNYILFVDSDDRLLPGSIDTLLDAAYANDLDIVEGGYRSFDEARVLYVKKHTPRMIENNKSGAELFGFPWNKLYRSELFQHFKFHEGYVYEDTIGVYVIYPLASRVGLLEDVTYEYRRNDNGIMRSVDKSYKELDSVLVTGCLLRDIFLKELEIDRDYLYDLTLRQVVTNYARCYHFSNQIKQALFVLTCDMVKKHFPQNSTSIEGLKDLETAIKNRNYSLYLLVLKTQ